MYENLHCHNLHCHTTTSDGELNYQQVLDLAQQNNISVVAFTDHDSLPDLKSLDLLKANKNHATKWIIGCEISSGWPKGIDKTPYMFDIVGLFVDPLNKDLIEHCRKVQESRIKRMEMMVKNLRSLGFDISKDDCLKESQGKTIGRPHLVAALKKKRKNLEIMERLTKKMELEAKTNPEIKTKYNNMIARGKDQYPYLLFLSKDAFIPDVYVPRLYYKDMDGTVSLIKNAGGVAILAHWSFCKKIINQEMVEEFLKTKRIDGAEIIFAPHAASIEPELKKDMETMELLTKKYNALQSGGSDAHNEQDLTVYQKEKWFAQKSIGLTKKMMENRTLNLPFSCLT
jgi:hypothetical protein